MRDQTDYVRAAEQYRPLDQSALASECARLLSSGLKVRDVATAWRLDIGEVHALLRSISTKRVSE